MAVVNIPFGPGGQAVGVEVPDFAMEATQQDVLSQAQRQTDALQAIAGKIGAQIQNNQSQTKKITDTLEKTSRDEQRKNQMSFEDLARGLQKPLTQAMSLSGKEKFSDLIGRGGILGTLGLGVMGAQIGTLVGILEEFGSSLNALRRTGAGLGMDFIELRNQAATVGIGMETLAKIVTENGPAVRMLGDNMVEGTNNFIEFSREMQDATRQAGYFGMGANEMAAFLVDELELRRLESAERLNEKNARREVIESLQENLKLNEVAASITGEDIQDRIAARNEFRRQAVVAAKARTMTEDQVAAQNKLVETFNQLGPTVSPILSKALTNLITGLPMDYANEEFTQLAAGLAARGVDIRDALQDGAAGINAGVDPAEIEAAGMALAGQIKNIEFSASDLAQAQAGVPSALLAVQASVESFSDGTDDVNEAMERLQQGLSDFATALENGDLSASRIALDSAVIGEQVRAGIVDGFLDAFNVDDVTNSGLGKLMEAMMDATKPDGAFTSFINAMIQGTTLLSGAQFVAGIAGIGNNDTLDHIINALGPAAMLLFQGGGGLFNRARGPAGGGPGGRDRDAARQSIRDQMNPNSSSFMGNENFSRLMPFLAGAGLGAGAMATVDAQSLRDAFSFTGDALNVHISSSSVSFNNNGNN